MRAAKTDRRRKLVTFRDKRSTNGLASEGEKKISYNSLRRAYLFYKLKRFRKKAL